MGDTTASNDFDPLSEIDLDEIETSSEATARWTRIMINGLRGLVACKYRDLKE